MFKDNLTDVEEEVVDALFNALVYEYRYPGLGTRLADSLIDIWLDIQELRKEEV